MKGREIKRKISEEGYIHARVVFEVIGTPKEFVEKALRNHLSKVEAHNDIELLTEHVEDPVEQDNFWSTFAEVEVLVKNLDIFTWMCINFMPASIEILAPDNLLFKPRNLTAWLNDLLSNLHEVSQASQQLSAQNRQMLKNVNALVRNLILMAIDLKASTEDEIAKKVGIDKKSLKPVFDAMVKENTIKKEGKKYLRK